MHRLSEESPGPLTLCRAHVPAALACLGPGRPAPRDDDLVLLDITLDEGRIVTVAPHDPAQLGEASSIDLGGRMVWPAPVDMHTHLDKGHIWPRAANSDGTFAAALESVARDRVARWSAEDVRTRMEFGLRCAYAHGTCAIRTHLDCLPPQAEIAWPVLAGLRAAWAGRITLQGVALCLAEHLEGSAGERLADLVAEHHGVLGLVPEPGRDLAADYDRLLDLAAARSLEVDLHVDESLDPEADALRQLAEAVLRPRFPHRVVAGHCCSLSMQEPATALGTLDLVAEAGIAIVSLPMCNLYLQDRVPGRTPRRRGVTLVHEIHARGIDLAFASDNTRDPFYAYGDLDMHEVFREAVRIGHLDHPFDGWAASIAATPARVMGLADAGRLQAGAPADLIIFRGRTWTEILSRPESERIVLRQGRSIDTTLPDYAELDPLFVEES
jgi:cytosine deaminase